MATFSPGQKLRAADLEALFFPAWTTYAIAWTSLGTQPAIGDGTLAGRYRRAPNTNLVIVEWRVVWGSTTTGGTGEFRWSLPFPAATASVPLAAGAGYVLDAGVTFRPVNGMLASTTLAALVSDQGGRVSATVPFTFGTADEIHGTLTYEPA